MKTTLVALVACLLTSTLTAQAPSIKHRLLEIADDIPKNNPAKTAAQAAALAEKLDEIDEVMQLLRPRQGTRPGVGVGGKPGAIKPDGIDQKLFALSRVAMGQRALDQEAADLERMAHVVGAVAEVTLAKPPKRKAKEWQRYAAETRAAAATLAAAARMKKPDELLKAARLVCNACNNCHTTCSK